MSGLWRQKLFPVCPACAAGSGIEQHRDCPRYWPGPGNPPLWIDITTGVVQCTNCEVTGTLDEITHFCECGTAFKGGEIWQGMAAEIGRVGNLAWARAAGLQHGIEKPVVVGWWFCLACGLRSEDRRFLLQGGTKAGGICRRCCAMARRRWRSWLPFRLDGKRCSYCKGKWQEISDTGRVVAVNRAYVCEWCMIWAGQKWKKPGMKKI